MGPPTPLQTTGGSAIGEVPGQAIAWSRPKAARDVREYLPIQGLQEAPREIDVTRQFAEKKAVGQIPPEEKPLSRYSLSEWRGGTHHGNRDTACPRHFQTRGRLNAPHKGNRPSTREE